MVRKYKEKYLLQSKETYPLHGYSNKIVNECIGTTVKLLTVFAYTTRIWWKGWLTSAAFNKTNERYAFVIDEGYCKDWMARKSAISKTCWLNGSTIHVGNDRGQFHPCRMPRVRRRSATARRAGFTLVAIVNSTAPSIETRDVEIHY